MCTLSSSGELLHLPPFLVLLQSIVLTLILLPADRTRQEPGTWTLWTYDNRSEICKYEVMRNFESKYDQEKSPETC